MIKVIELSALIYCLFLPTMSFSFNKKERLKSKKQIEKLFKEGKSVSRFPLKLFYIPVEDAEVQFKVAVSVPKRNFKKAVDRNRIKRLMREAYRLNKQVIFNNIEGNFALLILYLGKDLPRYRDVENSLIGVLHKLVKEIQ